MVERSCEGDVGVVRWMGSDVWRWNPFYTRQGRYLTSIVSGAYYKKKYRTVQRKGKS
jgi:hypothetical protein